MSEYNNYLSEVYSEDLLAGISDADFNEVMNASAVDEQGEVIDTPHGSILINRDCSHATCKTTRCERGATYGGIAI